MVSTVHATNIFINIVKIRSWIWSLFMVPVKFKILCHIRTRVDAIIHVTHLYWLDGQWARWLIGLMVNKLDGWQAQWLMGSMIDRLNGWEAQWLIGSMAWWMIGAILRGWGVLVTDGRSDRQTTICYCRKYLCEGVIYKIKCKIQDSYLLSSIVVFLLFSFSRKIWDNLKLTVFRSYLLGHSSNSLKCYFPLHRNDKLFGKKVSKNPPFYMLISYCTLQTSF